MRSFASEVKEGAKDESALAKEELKKEHSDANASGKSVVGGGEVAQRLRLCLVL